MLDANGNAAGGIRTPQVDAPIATLSDSGQGGGGFCFLFGSTTPFSSSQLAAAYPDHAAFLQAWDAAVDAAVTSGAVMPADRQHLVDAAQASNVGT